MSNATVGELVTALLARSRFCPELLHPGLKLLEQWIRFVEVHADAITVKYQVLASSEAKCKLGSMKQVREHDRMLYEHLLEDMYEEPSST